LHYQFSYNIGETRKMLNNFGDDFYKIHLLRNIRHSIEIHGDKFREFGNDLAIHFKNSLYQMTKKIDAYERDMNSFNPERQLKLGYSIIRINGKIIKSASQIKAGDELVSKLSDGEVYSKAEKIVNQ